MVLRIPRLRTTLPDVPELTQAEADALGATDQVVVYTAAGPRRVRLSVLRSTGGATAPATGAGGGALADSAGNFISDSAGNHLAAA